MTDSLRDQLQRALGDAYTLDRELMGGGMSRVFVAVERALDREVVVKVLPPDLAAGVNRDRFRREIQLAAQLQHPHIVPLLSAGESGELLYYTMPFIRGESLKAAMDTRGALAVREVVRVLHDVVDALAYAHDHGVIHRDIKPANVLMSGAHALITDFGVAKALSASLPVSGVTTAGIAIGTPAYMAPEQLAGDPAADHRVDVYAVGLLAYELLTGASPFSSLSPQQTMAAQLTRMPEPLAEVRPDVPTALSRLIQRCLAKNPDERPANARDLLTALDAVSTPQGVVYASRTGEATAVRRQRSTRVVALGAVVLTLGIASAVALTLVRRPAGQIDHLATPAVASAPVQAGAPAATPLTHDDSLAIAVAVQRHLAEARAASPAAPASDSVRHVLERAFADSIQQARMTIAQRMADSVRVFFDSTRFPFASKRGGVRDPGRVVFIQPHDAPATPGIPARTSVAAPAAPNAIPSPSAQLMDAAQSRRLALAAVFVDAVGRAPELTPQLFRALADSTRVTLGAASDFDVLDADEVSPDGATADAIRLARASRAGVGVSGMVRATGPGQFALQLFVSDLRSGWRYHVFTSENVPASELMRSVGPLTAKVIVWLAEPQR